MTSSREPDDLAEWSSTLQRAQNGSSRDFEQIYVELSPVVAGYLRMNGVVDVEGVTNEVFLQALRGLSKFRGDWVPFRAWLFTIAHHRIVDEHRRTTRQPSLVPMEPSMEGPLGDAEVDALEALSLHKLHALLDGLSEDQRSVLLLRVVADLPIDEVARTLDKSVGAVKSLQHRALASLRRALEVEGADA